MPSRLSLQQIRTLAEAGTPTAMLTCYDYTTARHLAQAGVKLLLVGDSAGNVILGHDSTVPVSLELITLLTQAVRRGAPDVLLMADLPFGSVAGSLDRAVENVLSLVQLSGCDCVKIEATQAHAPLFQTLADAGVATVAHLGLRPQTVAQNGYKAQGRTTSSMQQILETADVLAAAGASGFLLEAVPNEVSQAVVDRVGVPVIGCGAGPACHAHVVVLHDVLGLTDRQPRFAPPMGDLATPLQQTAARFVKDVAARIYPQPQHGYSMQTQLEKSHYDSH